MTVATGFDVDYYLDQVGADYYLTAAGEPPGIWAGRGAAALGLRGQVGGDKASAKAMRALFHYGIGPDGVPLSSRQRAPKYPARAVYAQVEEAIAKRVAALGRFATPEERREIRLQERAPAWSRRPAFPGGFRPASSGAITRAIDRTYPLTCSPRPVRWPAAPHRRPVHRKAGFWLTSASRGRGPSPGRWPRPGQGCHQQLRPGPLVLAGWAVLTTAASVLVFKRSAVN